MGDADAGGSLSQTPAAGGALVENAFSEGDHKSILPMLIQIFQKRLKLILEQN
jgi:hypothetical protein